MICKNCQKEINENAKFCNFCGEKFKEKELDIASSNRRFINLILDTIFASIFIYFFAYIIGYILGFLGIITASTNIDSVENILSSLLLCLYYIVFESIFGKSISKFITGTKVVTEQGEQPSLSQILKRSLSRLVPFDAFSFYGKYPVGWHDRWSKTRVVRNNIYK